MINTILRTELLASFEALQNRFKSSLDWAQARESEFGALRHRFVTDISEHLDRARGQIPKGSPIHDQVIGFIDVMDATRQEWDEKVLGREKGVEFQSTFGDSLLVFVNGKVKSGKSSLGNYMAWGNTDPTTILKDAVPVGQAPEYFSGERTGVTGGDVDGEAKSKREFRVNAVEATSSIQGFTLPGLTWADSPGLHSANRENGELAKRYVEHADLILYTMKSDAPGRESDLAEISGLFRKDKRVLLLLTGSDDTEDEVLDDGTIVTTAVMKKVVDRDQQKAYVRGALEKACGAEAAANVDILSISARYAQLHPDDPVRFADSGMGDLFETLHRVAQADGVALKARTPLTNLRHFLEGCHTDLQPYQTLLAGFRNPLQELRRDSDRRLGTVVHAAQRDLLAFIDSYFERIEAGRGAGDPQAELAAFRQALNGQFREIARQHLAGVFEDIMSGFATAVQNTYQSSEFVRLPDFELQKVTEKIPHVRSGTRKRNGLLGSIAGGALGFFLGGPAGAAAGMALGGSLGGATGDSASTVYREIEVTVGDNLQQIRLQALRDGQQALDRQIRAGAAALWQSIEHDVEQLLGRLDGEVRRFDTDLQELLQVVRQQQENA